MSTTVAALFATKEAAEAAVKDLRDIGIDADRISVVSSDTERKAIDGAPPFDTTSEIAGAGAVTGTIFGGTMGLLIGVGALAIPGIGPVLAAGPLLAALGAAAAGAGFGAAAGGMLGGLVSAGIPEQDAHVYAEGVKRGETLVMVNVIDGVVQPVETVINWHKPVNVEERAATLHKDGWTKLDTEAGPFEGDAIATFHEMVGDKQGVDTHEDPLAPASASVEEPHASAQNPPVAVPIEHVPAAPAPPPTNSVEMSSRATVPNLSYSVSPTVLPAQSTPAPAAEQDHDDPFYAHYQRTFAASGKPYENYGPVYRYGERLGQNEQYRAADWETVEPIARHEWESNNPDTWEMIKDAVHYAWDRARRIAA